MNNSRIKCKVVENDGIPKVYTCEAWETEKMAYLNPDGKTVDYNVEIYDYNTDIEFVYCPWCGVKFDEEHK